MKKVSVTDRYTYDGKEMSERDIEMYECGIKDGHVNWHDILFLIIIGFVIGLSVGAFLYKLLNH
jgi:hypothetical protein